MFNQQERESEERLRICLDNNARYIESLLGSRLFRCSIVARKKALAEYMRYKTAKTTEQKLEACTKAINAYENSFTFKFALMSYCICQDTRIWLGQIGNRKKVDYSDRKKSDYYSVVVIVKNEARYIREFILFYKAIGADRIYIYDNDSTDDLLEAIDPFLKSGFVVYRKWHGNTVQTAAYRDAIRKTKGNTRWLAIVDADEYLFSPRGRVPEVLRAYESYPGVGVNWVLYGPNGHDRRPKGLIMDNYTTRMADIESPINCHIKSIVQPREVLTIKHTHYAYYKNGKYAVDERLNPIDGRNAYVQKAGRAFTAHNNREIFRINHYMTKSHEDLEEKCRKGYADGASNANYEKQLSPFGYGLTEDYSIKEYADIVRNEMKDEKESK